MQQENMSTVVIIDDNRLKRQFLADILKNDFSVHVFPSEKEALPALPGLKPQCILLDMERPGEDCFQTIRNIRKNPVLAGVPLVFITSIADNEAERLVLENGGADYLGNRFSPGIIRTRVKNLAELYGYRCDLERQVEKKTQSVLQLQDAIILVLSDLVECRDEKTSGHAQRTRDYVARLIDQLLADGIYTEDLTPEFIRDIIRAAPLHDIGKIGIRDLVLNKPSKLTPEEFEEIKRHTIVGGSAIEHAMKGVHDNSFLRVLRNMAFTHHERWDGTGYPLGLCGASIPLCGRIMAIPDVYDALVSERPYKTPLRHEDAVELIREGVGKHFDPLVGRAFLACEQDFEKISQSLA